MKKKLLMMVSLLAVFALALTGTVAYLTDTDEQVNTMVVGNIAIEQLEYERVVDENGNPVLGVEGTDFVANYGITESYKLQEFTQDKLAMPAFYKNGILDWDESQQLWNQVGAPGSNDLFDDSVENVIDKFVFVENTGKNDAYYRTIIAIETPIGLDDEAIRINFNTYKDFDYNDEKAGNQTASEAERFNLVIDGTNYEVYTVTYTVPLKPDEISRPSLLQVLLDPSVTNEDVARFGEKWEILTFTQAVQTYDDPEITADMALDAAFGDISVLNNPWVEYEAASNADELVAALESDSDVALTEDVKINPAGMSNAYGTTGINVKNGQTIDGGGNTLDIKGAGGTWDSGINTTGGTINDLTVTGSFRGIFINHNSTHSERVILNNVIIDGTTYTISCDQGMNQGLTAYNSTFNGWTSYAGTLGDAEFINCSFGEGNGYAYCRPYAPTTFVNCEFEAGFTLDPRAAVVFENCTLDGVALTDANIADLVTSTANVTVK